MRHYLASSLVVLLAVSCGGSSENADFSSAGSASGGVNSGGQASAGSANAGSAGKGSAAGSSSGGSSGGNGTAGRGGGSSGSGQGGAVTAGSGGTGVVDPDCPALRPMGACEDAGTSCQYDYTNCLCYPTAPGIFIQCQKVDPTCTGVVTAAPPADPGAGGFSAKVALPPRQVCTCSAGTWLCAFGG